jgi:hypothetical protein
MVTKKTTIVANHQPVINFVAVAAAMMTNVNTEFLLTASQPTTIPTQPAGKKVNIATKNEAMIKNHVDVMSCFTFRPLQLSRTVALPNDFQK